MGTYKPVFRISLVEKSETGIRILDHSRIRLALIRETENPEERYYDLGPIDIQAIKLQAAFQEAPVPSLTREPEAGLAAAATTEIAPPAAIANCSSVRPGTGSPHGDLGASAAEAHHHTATVEARIGRAITFLENHFREDITLEQIAAAACLSQSHFCRLFKRQIGSTFTRVLASLRIDEAARLLQGTDLRVTDICYESGFNDLTHFERVFKQTLGTTPSRYRHHG